MSEEILSPRLCRVSEKRLAGSVARLVNDMLTDHWSVLASPLANEPARLRFTAPQKLRWRFR